jgi:predicted transcriptional regulator of viral defense system
VNSIEFLNRLIRLEMPLFQTRDMADILGISIHSAGKYLEALRKQNFVEKITRGKWFLQNSNLDPLQVAEFIVAPQESYISLHSALFYHGLIEQVPGRVYAVTVDRSKVVTTAVGTFSFHHCDPKFFTGYKYLKPYLKVATQEKALVDYFYFSPSKSRQFTRLPELEIPKTFSWKKALSYCGKIPSKRTRTLVQKRLLEIKSRKK